MGEEEIARVARAIAGEHLSQGAVTAEFEVALRGALGVPFVIMTPSGSAALLMAMMAIGVGPGDEVIVPNYTWIATAHGASLLGATVVLADTLPERPLLDIAEVVRLVTPRTKAVVAVHLNGRAVDMKKLNQLAVERGIRVVEDACQALFSRNGDGYLGTQSDIGCFSLGVTKLITTGQGGFVVTGDEKLFARLQAVRMHGVVRDADGVETYAIPGFNFKYTDIQAAIGLEQLSRAEERQRAVRAIHRRYAPALAELDYLRHVPVDVDGGELPIWVEVTTPHREELKKFLAARNIETNRTHPPLDRAPHLGGAGDYPNSSRFGREGLIVPCGPTQPLENVDKVLVALKEFRPTV
jgi:dTDP-4-amino-4,6-dideoxygalactose transaminase